MCFMDVGINEVMDRYIISMLLEGLVCVRYCSMCWGEYKELYFVFAF